MWGGSRAVRGWRRTRSEPARPAAIGPAEDRMSCSRSLSGAVGAGGASEAIEGLTLQCAGRAPQP